MPYEDRNRSSAVPAPKRPHRISMEDRKKRTVSGVADVESFDEKELVMETDAGTLLIRGEELSISKLSVDCGDVNVSGRICQLLYEESQPRRSLRERLFR